MEYILYELCVDGFPDSKNIYVLESLAYDVAFVTDAISGLNLVINEHGNQINGKRNNFQVGYISIAKNSACRKKKWDHKKIK